MPAILALLSSAEFLAGTVAASVGAWFGFKSTPNNTTTGTPKLDTLHIFLYAAGGLALFWLARKSGALKAFK